MFSNEFLKVSATVRTKKTPKTMPAIFRTLWVVVFWLQLLFFWTEGQYLFFLNTTTLDQQTLALEFSFNYSVNNNFSLFNYPATNLMGTQTSCLGFDLTNSFSLLEFINNQTYIQLSAQNDVEFENMTTTYLQQTIVPKSVQLNFFNVFWFLYDPTQFVGQIIDIQLDLSIETFNLSKQELQVKIYNTLTVVQQPVISTTDNYPTDDYPDLDLTIDKATDLLTAALFFAVGIVILVGLCFVGSFFRKYRSGELIIHYSALI